MTRKYELLYVINPAIGEEAIEQENERIQNIVAAQGEINQVDVWGNRRLAYEIQDEKEGYYVIVTFDSDPNIRKKSSVCCISDSVLRYLVVRADEED